MVDNYFYNVYDKKDKKTSALIHKYTNIV